MLCRTDDGIKDRLNIFKSDVDGLLPLLMPSNSLSIFKIMKFLKVYNRIQLELKRKQCGRCFQTITICTTYLLHFQQLFLIYLFLTYFTIFVIAYEILRRIKTIKICNTYMYILWSTVPRTNSFNFLPKKMNIGSIFVCWYITM